MRKAINALQAASMFGSTIHSEGVYKITATAHPEEIRELLETALEGDFLRARKMLDSLMVERGLSGEDVVGQVYRTLINMQIPPQKLVRIMDTLGETDFRLTEGADERIQLDALLARLAYPDME
jgi:replication factor C small subunit